MTNKLLIEFLGTFFLVLVIALTGDPLMIGVALTALVYMGGSISGAHFNPAVSLGMNLIGKQSNNDTINYIVAQLAGGLTAAVVYKFLNDLYFTPLLPSSSTIMSGLVVEALFTFLLVLVIFQVAISKRTSGNQYFGAAIGLTVMAIAAAGGPISGAAYNPAVAVGPLLFNFAELSANLPSLILYIVGPFLGGVLASLVYKRLN